MALQDVELGDIAPADRLGELAGRYGALDGTALLRPLIEQEFRERLAVVSWFRMESAVILAMVAEIDRSTPVLFDGHPSVAGIAAGRHGRD